MDDIITNLDLRLAHEDWIKAMQTTREQLRLQPYNCEPYAQAHLMNRFFRKVTDVSNVHPTDASDHR